MVNYNYGSNYVTTINHSPIINPIKDQINNIQFTHIKPCSDKYQPLSTKLLTIIMNHYYPLVICNIAIENGPVEIVDLPIQNGDFP